MSKRIQIQKGRGAGMQTHNPFLKHRYETGEWTLQDEPWEAQSKTRYLPENAKSIINKVESTDIGPGWSMNPYQGCEHGCIYCYARNTHEYYGYSAGLDFESIILVKKNAAELLENHFKSRKWKSAPVMLAGNTDCYQPAEKKFEITRRILEVCLKYKNPVGIITKNALILRDLDILTELAALSLVHVNVSITTLDENLRLKMEPRTATAAKKLEAIRVLREAGIPVRVLAAPMIPFINADELPSILEAASQAGALDASYILVRLNGRIGEIFTQWIEHHYPDKAERVLARIRETHNGNLHDHVPGRRMRGSGEFADMIQKLYRVSHKRWFPNPVLPPFDTKIFRVPGGQLDLFEM